MHRLKNGCNSSLLSSSADCRHLTQHDGRMAQIPNLKLCSSILPQHPTPHPQILERILRKPRVNQHPCSIKSWLFIHGRYGDFSKCYIWPSMLAASPSLAEMSPTRQWTDLAVWIHEVYNVKKTSFDLPSKIIKIRHKHFFKIIASLYLITLSHLFILE